jgi:alkylated DNA repair dioxygenase AlkB
LSSDEQQQILSTIYAHPFSTAIHRRQQHWGLTYYHTTHDLSCIQPVMNAVEEDKEQCLPLHPTFDWLLQKFSSFPYSEYNIFNKENYPTQILVNEYVGNQGIGQHMDSAEAFGDVVVGISLINPTKFKFTQPACLSHIPTNCDIHSISSYDTNADLLPTSNDDDNYNDAIANGSISLSKMHYSRSRCLCQAHMDGKSNNTSNNSNRSFSFNVNHCMHPSKQSWLTLHPGSCYVLRGEARYRYEKHIFVVRHQSSVVVSRIIVITFFVFIF